MNSTSKIFIVFALMCVSTTVAHSQECNSYLQRAAEKVSQKQYCDALNYYREYGRCNADADVSTEIAMCERFCKIRKMEGEEVEPVGPIGPIGVLEQDNWDTRTSTGMSQGNRNDKPKSFSTNEKFKLGLSGGIISSTEKGSKILYGGGFNSEYLVSSKLGIGVNANYYGCLIEEGGVENIISSIPVALTSKYYFLTKSIQPYVGVDIGLYYTRLKIKSEGEAISFSSSDFFLAPVIGLQFKLSNSIALDINSKYNIVFLEGKTGYNVCANLGLVFYF